jgi:hypothetical protein
MQDDQMIIDGTADEAQPTVLNLVDRRRRVTLPEQ